MKKTLVLILIAIATVAAAFSWQAAFAGTKMDGMDHGMDHGMGVECLAHCFMADAEQADLVAVVATMAFAVLATVAWPSVASVATVARAFVPEYAFREPWHRFLLSRRD